MARDTGFPRADAQTDFGRARRRRAMARLAARLRREPDDVDLILPFEEVVEALGYEGERRLGLRTIALDSIVGTVDRSREFDRSFRPTSSRVRPRWEGIALAERSGRAMPPIDVYRVGELHFVKDGHHRVSVARAQGRDTIDAYVTEVITSVGPEREIRLADLPLKSHERLFFERVPLPAELRSRVRPSKPSYYAELAECVEAWGFRLIQATKEHLSREQVAERWFHDEYEPVVEMLKEAGLHGHATDADAYMAVIALRYLLLRTHEWDENVLNALREEMRRPSFEDTEVRRLRRSLD
jgi:hypothetical protein